jgi:predicted nucleotidyltransferase
MDAELTARIQAAAEVLKSLGAREVRVFGSAALGTLRPDSDVDLAVAGLPPEVFFRAIGRASAVLHRNLDLVDLDEDNRFARYLVENGKLRRVA